MLEQGSRGSKRSGPRFSIQCEIQLKRIRHWDLCNRRSMKKHNEHAELFQECLQACRVPPDAFAWRSRGFRAGRDDVVCLFV